MSENKLTPSQIEAMPAGRELDCLVAKVCGFAWAVHDRGGYVWRPRDDAVEGHQPYLPMPDLSADIAAALMVAECFGRTQGGGLRLEQAQGGGWYCYTNAWYADPEAVFGDTIPLAICRAVLIAASEAPTS